MIPIPSRTTVRQRRASDVLLGYLESVRCWWPGADGLTVEDALSGYAQAAGRGLVPDRETLLHRHPELSDALLELLAVDEVSS